MTPVSWYSLIQSGSQNNVIVINYHGQLPMYSDNIPECRIILRRVLQAWGWTSEMKIKVSGWEYFRVLWELTDLPTAERLTVLDSEWRIWLIFTKTGPTARYPILPSVQDWRYLVGKGVSRLEMGAVCLGQPNVPICKASCDLEEKWNLRTAGLRRPRTP